MDASKPLTVPVLLGSVRRDRQGIRAARLIVAALRARGHEPVLVDPLELQLPLLDRMYKEHETGSAPEELERLATLYRRRSEEHTSELQSLMRNSYAVFCLKKKK